MKEKKYLSILGDSISTFEGVSNNSKINKTIGENQLYYNVDDLLECQKIKLEETYRSIVAKKANFNLLVVNASSGRHVRNFPNNCNAELFDGGCLHPCVNLHDNNGIEPNHILIYLGINDVNYLSKVNDPYQKNNKPDLSSFNDAYFVMLDKITKLYPDAKVTVMTLIPAYEFINETGLQIIESYNEAIKKIAKEFDFQLIDLYKEIDIKNFSDEEKRRYSFDGLHPSAYGHSLIADIITKSTKY